MTVNNDRQSGRFLIDNGRSIITIRTSYLLIGHENVASSAELQD